MDLILNRGRGGETVEAEDWPQSEMEPRAVHPLALLIDLDEMKMRISSDLCDEMFDDLVRHLGVGERCGPDRLARDEQNFCLV